MQAFRSLCLWEFFQSHLCLCFQAFHMQAKHTHCEPARGLPLDYQEQLVGNVPSLRSTLSQGLFIPCSLLSTILEGWVDHGFADKETEAERGLESYSVPPG